MASSSNAGTGKGPKLDDKQFLLTVIKHTNAKPNLQAVAKELDIQYKSA